MPIYMCYIKWLDFDRAVNRDDTLSSRSGHNFTLVLVSFFKQPLDQDNGQRAGTEDQRQDHCPQNAG